MYCQSLEFPRALCGGIDPKAFSVSEPVNRDFSTVERFGASLINPMLGRGSWLMGDTLGGFLVTGGEISGLALLVIGNGSPESMETSRYASYAGVGLVAGSLVFSYIRPFMYHKSRIKAEAESSSGISVSLLPSAGENGRKAVKLSYTVRY